MLVLIGGLLICLAGATLYAIDACCSQVNSVTEGIFRLCIYLGFLGIVLIFAGAVGLLLTGTYWLFGGG